MGPEGKVLAAAKAAIRKAGGLALRLNFRAGVASGWPDLVVLLPGGRLLFMECKRLGGKPTPLQTHIMGKLRELGFATVICDSADAARSAVASTVGATPLHGAGGRASADSPLRRPPA